jgi:cytochrome b
MDIGHNPIGGWSVLILISLMLLQVGLGLFSVDIDGLDSGPLSTFVPFDLGRRIAHLHHTVFNVLLVFACAHIAAVLYYLIVLRRNLITPMITGSAEILETARERASNPIFASWQRLSVGIVIAVALTSAIVLL